MPKDTQDEPVETIEDSISAAIDEAEKVDEPEEEVEIAASGEPDEAGDEAEDDSGVVETESLADNADDDTPDEEVVDEIIEEPLEAPEHWAAADREAFNAQPRPAQEFLLKRHKEMEGHLTQKSQAMSDIQRQYDAVRDALAPYEDDFSRSGLDHAGAVRQLAHWHKALKTGGKPAVLELARTYGIDLDEPEEYVDPALAQTQSQLAEIRNQLTRQNNEAQQREQAAIEEMILNFRTETDESGALKNPHFATLENEITALLQAKLATNLEDGYKKALALRPDLTPAPPVKKPVTEIDPAKRAAKAKKAATGVKSSGAVGKRDRSKMTLEEEVAANL